MALAFGFRPLPIIYYDKQEKEEAPKEKKGGHWEHWGQQRSSMFGNGVLYALVQGTLGVLIVSEMTIHNWKSGIQDYHILIQCYMKFDFFLNTFSGFELDPLFQFIVQNTMSISCGPTQKFCPIFVGMVQFGNFSLEAKLTTLFVR